MNERIIVEIYQSPVSECCLAEDRAIGEDGPDFSDLGLCPKCRDRCEFIEENKDE